MTSFPVDEALPQRKPGVYVLTAVSANGSDNEWDSRRRRNGSSSPISAVTTYAGTDGLNVFARSLATAKPIAGVELTAACQEQRNSRHGDDRRRTAAPPSPPV